MTVVIVIVETTTPSLILSPLRFLFPIVLFFYALFPFNFLPFFFFMHPELFFRFSFLTKAFAHTNKANIHHHESLYCKMKLINESPPINHRTIHSLDDFAWAYSFLSIVDTKTKSKWNKEMRRIEALQHTHINFQVDVHDRETEHGVHNVARALLQHGNWLAICHLSKSTQLKRWNNKYKIIFVSTLQSCFYLVWSVWCMDPAVIFTIFAFVFAVLYFSSLLLFLYITKTNACPRQPKRTAINLSRIFLIYHFDVHLSHSQQNKLHSTPHIQINVLSRLTI